MSHWEEAGEAGTSYVEGVGDEVLLTATFIIIALCTVVLVFRPNLDLTAFFRHQIGAQAAQNNGTPEQENVPQPGGADGVDGQAAPTVAAVPAPRRWYNWRFSGEPHELMEYLLDLPTLLRHLWAEFYGDGGLFLMFRVRVVVCFMVALLYVAPPDILPESVFGLLGLFDDIFIMVLIMIFVSAIYRRYVAARL